MPLILNYLLLFSLPIYLIRLSIIDSISVNLLEILIITTIIINYYTLFKITSFKKVWQQFYKNKNLSLPILLIICGFIFSYLYNQQITHWKNWTDGLGKILDLIILPIIYGFSLTLLISFKKISLQKSTLAYYISSIIISLFGLICIATNNLTFDHRLSIFFQSPNQLAIFLAPAFILSLFSFKKSFAFSKTLSITITKSIFTLLIFINIYSTKSLGALLSLAIIILSILIIYYQNHTSTSITKKILSSLIKLTPKIFFTINIFALLFIINADIFLKYISYKPNTPPTSYDSRLAIYQVDQKLIANNWLSGVGAGNFQNIYLTYQKYFPPYPQWAVPHGHNTLIHFWIEGGLMAGLGLLLLYSNILLNHPKLKQKKKPFSKTISLLIITYFTLHGLVDTTIWTPATATLFWTIVILHFKKTKPISLDLSL